MADATAAGKNITSCHFQIIVNGFQPVFHIHWFFVKGVYLSNIKVGGDNLIESIKLLFSKIVLCYFYIRTMDFVMFLRGKHHIFFFCIGTLIDYFGGGMLVGSPVHFVLNLFEEYKVILKYVQ